MNERGLVGIVGGYGAVGRVVAARLSAAGVPLRIGGRDSQATAQAAATIPRAQGVVVDLRDPISLSAFCHDCSVVVNGAGPSKLTAIPVARAAVGSGAAFVDPGGSPVTCTPDAISVSGAGVMPGLSGLLPRWLAQHQHFERVLSLSAYVGGHGRRLTRATAADFLLESHEAGPQKSSQLGMSRLPTLLVGPAAEYFPATALAYSHRGAEAQRVAQALGLSEVDWHNVFAGNHLLAALGRVKGTVTATTESAHDKREGAVDELVRAAELDLFGLAPYQIFYFRLEGQSEGQRKTLTLVLRATDPAELTGTVAAIAVKSVLAGEISPGAHCADEVLGPPAVAQLVRSPAIVSFRVFDTTAGDAEPYEAGEL